VFGNLLFHFVDELARMTEARQRSFRAAKPVNVFVEGRVETQHIAHVLLEVTLQTTSTCQVPIKNNKRTQAINITMSRLVKYGLRSARRLAANVKNHTMMYLDSVSLGDGATRLAMQLQQLAGQLDHFVVTTSRLHLFAVEHHCLYLVQLLL